MLIRNRKTIEKLDGTYGTNSHDRDIAFDQLDLKNKEALITETEEFCRELGDSMRRVFTTFEKAQESATAFEAKWVTEKAKISERDPSAEAGPIPSPQTPSCL